MAGKKSHAKYASRACKDRASGQRRQADGRYYDVERRQDRARDRYYAQYGVDDAWYHTTLAAQGGHCATCHRTPEQEGKRLAVDHCHVTGLVRGILCENCNRALGMLADDPDRIEALARYLRGR